MIRLRGEIAAMLRVLGLPQGHGDVLDAIALAGRPGEVDGFLRDDGTTADYLVLRSVGTELRWIDGALASVLIRTQPEEGYGTHPRPHALIDGLSATATRQEVRDALGAPEASAPRWDRYRVEGGYVLFRFADERTSRITVMQDVPR
ncbi:hypothetical protein GCM10009846_24960 [Agrococcus versicolor]|uniref:Uncharacterized protein n=1 Tax=Agrococcus versicolor TaxID=501482 RepID=A0ABN3AW16_9MICO